MANCCSRCEGHWDGPDPCADCRIEESEQRLREFLVYGKGIRDGRFQTVPKDVLIMVTESLEYILEPFE